MGAAGGLPLPIRGPSGFFKFHFSPWFSKLSVALRSSLLGSAPTSSPLMLVVVEVILGASLGEFGLYVGVSRLTPPS